MPEDPKLEQARRDYATLDRERQKGVDQWCSRYGSSELVNPTGLWVQCFKVRVAWTKQLQDTETQERQRRLDAHKSREMKQRALRDQRKKEREDKEERLRQPQRMQGPPKPDVYVPPSVRTRYNKLHDNYKHLCDSTPSMWFCNDDEEEAVKEYARREENQRLAANQRRRESRPPAMRQTTAKADSDRIYHMPGSPSTRRA